MASQDQLQRSQEQLKALDSSVKQGHDTGKDKSITASTTKKQEVAKKEELYTEKETSPEPESKEKGTFGKLKKLAQKLFSKASEEQEQQAGKGKVIEIEGILVATMPEQEKKGIKHLDANGRKELSLIMETMGTASSKDELSQASALGRARNQADNSRGSIEGRDPTKPEQ